jgi:hypothetical protein
LTFFFFSSTLIARLGFLIEMLITDATAINNNRQVKGGKHGNKNFDCLADRVTRLGEFSPNARFGKFFKNYTSNPKLWATLFQRIDYVLILTKNGLGYILGDFFTNSSGTLFADHASSVENVYASARQRVKIKVI